MTATHRIALVTPSERIRDDLARRLLASGFGEVFAAARAGELSGLRPSPLVELAIVDVDSGGEADLGALEPLKKLDAFRVAKVLVLTASRRLQAMDLTLGNVAGVLVKPFGVKLFLETVAELLGEPAPRATVPAPGEAEVSVFEEPEASRRDAPVLIVDDSASMRHIVREYLTRMGFHRVECAANYAEADRLLETERFALILSDLRMPGRSGLDLLDRVRADLRHAGTPFVLVSSDCGYATAFLAGRRGASAFLPKPFKQDGLEKAVAAALAAP